MVVPPSPPARRIRPPSWLEPRLLAGVLMVLVSVTTGAKIVAAADRSVRVWSVARDIAPGTVLAAEDLRAARVRLFDTAPTYLSTADSPAGQAVTRALAAGELLPAAALHGAEPASIVNLPVRPENAPEVSRGQAVDVWASTRDCGPRRVLSAAAVQDVRTDGTGALSAGAGALQVVVRVGPADAERLLAALGPDATIRLVVVEGEHGSAGAPRACVRPGPGATSAGGN